MLRFRGAVVTSNAGLLVSRDLDDAGSSAAFAVIVVGGSQLGVLGLGALPSEDDTGTCLFRT